MSRFTSKTLYCDDIIIQILVIVQGSNIGSILYYSLEIGGAATEAKWLNSTETGSLQIHLQSYRGAYCRLLYPIKKSLTKNFLVG